MNKQKIWIAIISLALAMASVVVVLGAFTRLADAGLGCPDWPTCYGHLWVPNEAHEIHAANQSFVDTPVETDKTWPEQIHRIFASQLGLVILVIFGFALAMRAPAAPWKSIVALLLVLISGTVARIVIGDSLDPILLVLVTLYFGNLIRLRYSNQYQQSLLQSDETKPFLLPALLAGLVIVQGLFGMWTVTLKLWPQVVTGHLMGGFATISLIWLLLQKVSGLQWRGDFSVPVSTLKKIALVAMLIVIVQIMLGGWTSSNYAALACPDFPLCQNSIWPKTDFAHGFNIFQHVGPNYLGGLLDNYGRVAIHLTHRIGAIVTSLAVLFLAYKLWLSSNSFARRWAIILVAVLCIQVSLGISNVIFSLPLTVAVIHNAVGALLLLVMVAINHRLRSIKPIL